MSKLKKLRRAPKRFFSDAKNPVVRQIGGYMAEALIANGLDTFVYDPVGSTAKAKLPVLSGLTKKWQKKRALRRKRILAQAEYPLVSVIMPAFNAAQTIEKSITSLLKQNYTNLEIIVISDGSCDNTSELVQKMAAADTRIWVHSYQKSRGAALARNYGMSLATGDYLCFQDADDFSTPDRIERQLEALISNPSATMSVCDYHRIDDLGNELIINGRKISRSIISMMFHRAKVLDRIGYMLASKVSEDAEFYQRIKLVFGPSCEQHIAKQLYIAGYHPKSLLFGDGKVQKTEDGNIMHTPSDESQTQVRAFQAWHQKIERHQAAAYVNVRGEKE